MANNSLCNIIILFVTTRNNFYCLWEELFNEKFKLAESREFKNDLANQSFTMSLSRWINMTNAIGFTSKRGKYDARTLNLKPIDIIKLLMYVTINKMKIQISKKYYQ